MAKDTVAPIVSLTLVIATTLGGAAKSQTTQSEPRTFAEGVVFHDANGNRKHDAAERTLPHVRVSNGRHIVATDQAGRYRLPVDDDTILFVIKPRDWRTPLSKENLPRFYYIHKPGGSPEFIYKGVAPTGPLPASVDFPLSPQQEPAKFQALLFGDPQPRDQKEIDYISHDVIEELVGTKAHCSKKTYLL